MRFDDCKWYQGVVSKCSVDQQKCSIDFDDGDRQVATNPHRPPPPAVEAVKGPGKSGDKAQEERAVKRQWKDM